MDLKMGFLQQTSKEPQECDVAASWQCDPAGLDLFDGVDDEDEFTSIGIGARAQEVIAKTVE